MLKVQRVSDSVSLLSLTSKPQLISVRESVARTPKKLSASPSKKNVRTDASVLKEVQNTPKRSKSAVRVDIKRTTPSPKRNVSPSRNNTTTIRVEGQAKLPSQTIRPKKQYEKQKEEQERLREEIFAVNRLMKMLDDKKWKMAEMANTNLERMTLTVLLVLQYLVAKMGQKKSKETAKSPQSFQYSWEVNRNPPRLKTRQELNIDDFVVKGRRGEIIVREPGSVGGQQFVIEDCENCDFFIFDFSAEFSADDCKNCRFFVGPVEGSFFIRTSKDCKAVVACKQFRTRDCSNIDVLLYAQGRPIIEATQSIRIGCFSTFYVGLQEQFKNAKLSVFNNRWNIVHDFTPQSGGGQNYSFLPNTTRESDFLKPFHTAAPNWITEQEEKMNQSQFVVPVTVGPSDTSMKPNVAIIFLPGHSEDAHQFLQSLYTKYADKLSIHDSKEWKLNKQELDTALAKSAKSDELSLLKKDGVKGPIIALAIVDKSEQIGAAVKQCAEGSTSAKSFYLAKSEAESECINNFLFNVHKTET